MLPAAARTRTGRPSTPEIVAGLALLASGFVARAYRLNFLVPAKERLTGARGVAIAATAAFFAHIVPFRGGEAVSWALFRKELDTSWSRSAGILLLVKTVDTAATWLAGLAGAAALLLESHIAVLGWVTALWVCAGIVILAVLPRTGSALIGRLAGRLSERRQLRRIALGVRDGLEAVKERPRDYFAAFLFSLAYQASVIAGVYWILAGLGWKTPLAVVSVAMFLSATSALLPSPAGTFGSTEAGFAAGLTLAGIPLAEGVLAGTAAHVAVVLAAGLCALPILLPRTITGNAA